jgi:hypothetical protein
MAQFLVGLDHILMELKRSVINTSIPQYPYGR